MAKPRCNFVITAQPVQVYDATGRPTDIWRERIQRQTRFMCDLVLHLEKRYDTQLKKTRYIATIDKCRYQRGLDLEIEDVTYKKLVKALREKLGVVIKSG